jgi:uncharacterized membrane protein YphA (DoxX/SURF4 family)
LIHALDAADVLDGYEVMGSAMNRWSPYVLSILRIITAFLYMVHGTQKLFGFPAPFPVPHLPPLFLAGGMIETFGGLLLLIGLFTRPFASSFQARWLLLTSSSMHRRDSGRC